MDKQAGAGAPGWGIWLFLLGMTAVGARWAHDDDAGSARWADGSEVGDPLISDTVEPDFVWEDPTPARIVFPADEKWREFGADDAR